MMRRRGGKATKLLFYILSGKSNVKNSFSKRSTSLYIALLFAIFFALMIILQILSVEKNNNDFNIESDGILGRFRLFSKKSGEKEILFPPKIAQELERIIESAEYSVDLVSNQSNQSNDSNDYYYRELTTKDHWQEVSNSRHKFFVFSAYYDDRTSQTYIRIIAATKTRTEEKVYCKLWFAHTYPPAIVNAINKLIRENWNLKYSAYFILCPLSKGSPVPDSVSVIIRETKTTTKVNEEFLMPSNRLMIHKNPRISNRLDDKSIEPNIAVCVKPLHYEYNKVLKLIEFIEMNGILGVTQFILYNHTVGPNVDCVLREYIDSGLITMLSWNLNMESQKEIRTEGLFAALNDCLYRTMNRYKYVLMIDIDELIVPYRHSNLLSMLKSMSKLNGHRTGAYSFRNAFFYSQWPDDKSISNKKSLYRLTTLLKTRRKTQLNIHKQRSKCIVIPENVVEMGNHFVWEFLPTKFILNIDPKLGILHHYRVCEFGGDDCIKANSVIERRAHFWKEKLITRVNTNINKWSKFCNILLNETFNES